MKNTHFRHMKANREVPQTAGGIKSPCEGAGLWPYTGKVGQLLQPKGRSLVFKTPLLTRFNAGHSMKQAILIHGLH